MRDAYLVWSNEHRGWWRPGGAGYTRRIDKAALYSHSEAMDICLQAMVGRRGNEPLREIPVALHDVNTLRQRFDSLYPGRDPEPPE